MIDSFHTKKNRTQIPRKVMQNLTVKMRDSIFEIFHPN